MDHIIVLGARIGSYPNFRRSLRAPAGFERLLTCVMPANLSSFHR